MGRKTSKPPARRFKGFVALERPDGPLLWGTFRPTESEARRQFEQWNPMREPVIVQVNISFC
jgi:hypothetical protein